MRASLKFESKQALKLCHAQLTQLSMRFILLINLKMPTMFDILAFISRIDITTDILKAKNIFIFQHFSFYVQLKFHAQGKV